MTQQITTIATWCVPIVAALDKHGVDPAPLFEEAGLDLSRIYEPNLRFPVTRMTALWNLAATRSGNPAFALEVSKLSQPGAFQGLGAALMVSTSLRDAALRIARYSRLVSNAAEIIVSDTNGVLSMEYQLPVHGVEISDHALTAFMATATRFAQMISLEPLTASRACFPYPAPDDVEPWREIFGPQSEFAQPGYRLELDAEVTLRPLPGGNATIAALQDKVLAEYLAKLDDSSIVDQVRRTLLRQLPSGEPKLSGVATELSLSASRLQRALSAEGTTFKQLLSDTRRQLAETWVGESATPLTQIAFDLGFAEQASFTRAFRRWTGMSPSAFRDRTAGRSRRNR